MENNIPRKYEREAHSGYFRLGYNSLTRKYQQRHWYEGQGSGCYWIMGTLGTSSEWPVH